ncbi:MAG: GNAT family N-acetyltransferase [Breznakibacter sp.]|nr:GNAT family N-acetyltransferase [Breznakibacter sp.]
MILQYLNDGHLPAVLAIADSRFGKGYITRDELTNSSAIVLVGVEQGVVVGFVLFYLMPSSEFPIELYGNYPQGDRALYVKSVAVHNGFERRGYATALLNMVINIARRQNVICCYAYLWITAGAIPAGSVFDALGFEPVLEINNFWYQSSMKQPFDCPICGHPCRCSAQLVCRSLVKRCC